MSESSTRSKLLMAGHVILCVERPIMRCRCGEGGDANKALIDMG